MAAAAALIKYVEYIQHVMFAQNSLKVTYFAAEKSCFIGNKLLNLYYC